MLALRLVLVLALLLSSCASHKPFEPHAIDEIQTGPGLFSDEAGEFSIYRKKRTR